MTARAVPAPAVRTWLLHGRNGLAAASLLLIAASLLPLAGLAPREPAHTLGLLGCQLLGLSLTLGNALDEGGLRGFLRAQAIGLGGFALLRALYLAQPPGAALLAESLVPAGLAAGFLFLRSRL